MTLAWETTVHKLEAKLLQQMFGIPIYDHVNKMRGAIAAVYAEANTSHDSFPLGSKFGFSADILKKDKYIALHNTVATGIATTAKLETTCLFTQPSWTDMYDDTILAVHPDVSHRKKEAQRAELITSARHLKDTRRHLRKKMSLPVM